MQRRGATLEQAYVLHRREYRDTSAIVELFTREHGRVGVVARGMRSRRSQAAALLQPFRRLLVSWQARGELGTLTSVEPDGAPTTPAGRRLASGFYANELLLRLLRREDPAAPLFDAYAGLLAGLASASDAAVLLRYFERDLLAALGYGLSLEIDAGGEPVVADRPYRYELERGPVPLPTGASRGTLVLDGASLLALARRMLDTVSEPQARRLTRAALRLYLGDRPLRSRELLTRVRRTD